MTGRHHGKTAIVPGGTQGIGLAGRQMRSGGGAPPPNKMPAPENLDPPFHPISGPKASAEVVDQITHAISSGRFQPGSRLPNIDDLARLMNVSRPTVGDALRILAKAGVIETRRGNTGGVLVS